MGSRANVAIREKGRVRLHYTSNGAPSLLGDLFFGLADAERAVKRLYVDERWLQETDAEAGAVIDKDTSTLLVFGPISAPPVQALLVQLMARAWPGWKVEWADDEQRTLVSHLGLPTTPVEVDRGRPEPFNLDQLAEPYPSRFALRMGLVVVCQPNKPDRYISGLDMMSLVAHGHERTPAVLECLPTAEEVSELARAVYPDDPNPLPGMVSTGLYIGERSVVIAAYASLGRRLAELADLWPGFSLERWAWDLDLFFSRIGQPIPEALSPRPTISLDDKLAAIGADIVRIDGKFDKKRAARFGDTVRAELGDVAHRTWTGIADELRASD